MARSSNLSHYGLSSYENQIEGEEGRRNNSFDTESNIWYFQI